MASINKFWKQIYEAQFHDFIPKDTKEKNEKISEIQDLLKKINA